MSIDNDVRDTANNRERFAMEKTRLVLTRSWANIQDAMILNGGFHILDQNVDPDERSMHRTSVFIEMNTGEFAGEWLFTDIAHAISAVSNPLMIQSLASFNDHDYLVSIHSADGH